MESPSHNADSEIAAALNRIADVAEKFFDRLYPARKEGAIATVTTIKTEEEKLREAQGFSEESDEEWVGPRERRAIEAQALSKAPRGTQTTRGNRRSGAQGG